MAQSLLSYSIALPAGSTGTSPKKMLILTLLFICQMNIEIEHYCCHPSTSHEQCVCVLYATRHNSFRFIYSTVNCNKRGMDFRYLRCSNFLFSTRMRQTASYIIVSVASHHVIDVVFGTCSALASNLPNECR